VYTHSHGDHAGGSAPFQGATVFAHASAPAGLRRLAERDGAGILWPEVVFEGDLGLDPGGKALRLIPTPGHSRDSVCLYLVQDGILFAGDTAVTGIPPAFAGGDGAAMAASLRRLAALDVAVLVPGHGPVLRGAPAVRAWLTWLADYLDAVQGAARRVLAADRPSPVPEAAGGEARRDALVGAVLEIAPHDRLVGDRLPLGTTEVARRHRNNAIAALEAQRRDAHGRGAHGRGARGREREREKEVRT
jgi:glyoxylase-like metal-dependent hydrolase (beta-lactamase superfamily II)